MKRRMKVTPSALLFLGGVTTEPTEARGEGKSFPYSDHNSNYIVEPAIPVGTKLATTAVFEPLAHKPAK